MLRHSTRLVAIVDRPRTEAALAVAAAWLAFMAGLVVEGDVTDVASFAVSGAIGVALVFLGFAAGSHVRTLSRSEITSPARLAVLSLAIGIGLGLANLAANWAIAATHPTLRALLVERMATVRPRDAVFAAPLIEEVAIRLFLMSVMAWLVFRVTKRAGIAFAVALVGSAFVFALLHLFRPIPLDPTLANYYRAALVVKYTLAGVPLGWIFWRWGLPYSIVCHGAANAVHVALEEGFF